MARAIDNDEARIAVRIIDSMPDRRRKELLEQIDADLREDVHIIVGGAPVTQEFADDMGADGYGKDALDCVSLAKKMTGKEA